jgi:hypothetical protein
LRPHPQDLARTIARTIDCAREARGSRGAVFSESGLAPGGGSLLHTRAAVTRHLVLLHTRAAVTRHLVFQKKDLAGGNGEQSQRRQTGWLLSLPPGSIGLY